MSALTSTATPRPDYRDAHLQLLQEVRDLEAAIRDRSAAAAPKFDARNQLLPRDRVARLLDPGAPFLELSTLAGLGLHDDDAPDNPTGGGSIAGIGTAAGVRILVLAHDSAIKGGSVTPMGLQKSLRAQRIARDLKLPFVSLVESGGANLLHQSELFVEGGRVFANMARASAAGLPQITVVHGSSTAGGAYIPGLSDVVIAVQDRAKVFLAGPPLVKAAIGEDAQEEDLGGALMHATVSGTAEHLARDDAHALDLARQVLHHLAWERNLAPPTPLRTPKPPRYDPDTLLDVIPPDPKQPYDAHELIARLVDDSDFLPFKPRFGPHTLCGHAAIEGHSVGLIANNGPILPECSVKVAQFIQLCCQSGTPLVFLQNTTGYMVGTDAERRGAVKHGAKMIQAVANATVPKLTLIVGGSYGAGNYGMCGRAFDPQLLFAWPNAKIAVMGGDQAAGVMKQITLAKLARAGNTPDPASLEPMAQAIRDQLDQEAKALYATARLWDDGIIDPRDSRRVLALALATADEARRRTLHPNTFGVARG